VPLTISVRLASSAAKASVVLLSLSSCSLVLDTSKVQCNTDSDCAEHDSNLSCVDQVCVDATTSRPWACLGNVAWPSGTSAKVVLALPVVDVITSAFPRDLQVRACSKLNVDCTPPLSATVDVSSTPGLLKVALDSGFDGYLELTSPTITPALFFVVKPVWEDTTLTSPLPVVSRQGFQGIAQAIGTTLDLTSMGHVYALASDCTGTSAAGVRFEVDKKSAQTAGYYMINMTPVSSSPATDSSGAGGFLNLPTGFSKLTGYVSATGARIGEVGFVIRAGAVSYPRLIPTPN
jgi:hypothetical protein